MSDPAPAARPPAQRGPGRGLWALIGAAHVVAVGLLVAAHWNGGLHVHRPGHGHHELRSVGAAPARPAAGGSPPPPPPHRNPYLWEAVHWLDRHRAAAGPAARAAPAVEGERAAGTAGGDGGGGGAPYAGKKVALMGMAESYTWKDLATYVGSAREAGFAGDIVLFTNTADAETRRWFGLVGVRQVQWDRQWTRGLPGNTARHALYARFAPEYDFVLASDTRDVHFQRDPFGEEELRAGADLHVYGEPATLGNNAGHDGMFRRCFNPSFLQTNAKRSMLNGGAMFGTGAAVGAFSGRLTAFVHEFVAFAKAKGGDGKGCMGSDQIVVNYLLYGPPHRDGKLKDIAFKVWEHGTGLVNNRVLMDKRYSEAERAKMKNAAGEVLNHDGRVACVVHKGHYRRRKPKFEAAAGALLKADKGKGRVNPYSEEGASALTERAAKAGAAQGTPPAAAKCVLKNDRSDCGERPGVEGDVQQFPQLRPALEAAVGGQFCLGMLSMQGVKTLQRTLDSYCRNGLLGLAGEKVLFFQNDEPGTEIYKWRREIAEMYGFEVMTDRKNVAYQSFDRMAKACGKDFIVFLEEDFKLVEQRDVVLQQLDNAFRLLKTGRTDVVRMRHRWRFGAPYFSYYKKHAMLGEILAMPSKLRNPEREWGQRQSGAPVFVGRYLTKCVDVPATYCTNSTHTRFTTNPAFYRTSWFTEVLGPHMYKPYIQVEPALKEWPRWKAGDFKVARPRGLFEHKRIDRSNGDGDIAAWRKLHAGSRPQCPGVPAPAPAQAQAGE